MTLTLEPGIEERIERQLASGRYDGAGELIAALLDLVEMEESELRSRRLELSEKLRRGYDQASRGELYTPEEARAMLAERRAARAGE
jgi:antitoxin ParD1/3/4